MNTYKKIVGLFIATCAFAACDYNDKYFDGLGEGTTVGVSKYNVEYTDVIFKESESAKDKIVPWLNSKYYTCENSSFAIVSYKQEKSEVKKSDVLSVDFERNVIDKESTNIAGWLNYSFSGIGWYDKVYSSNTYTELSAYKLTENVESWLISPKNHILTGDKLSFDVCVGNYNGNVLKVLISTNFTGNSGNIKYKNTVWNDVTSSFDIPVTPVKGYGTLKTAGTLDLSKYAGQNIYIAFVFEGQPDNVTTTMQLDNVKIERVEKNTVINTEKDEYDFKDGEWIYKRTIPSGLLFETVNMESADFQLIVDYVTENFEEGYLDTQAVGQGEYYYGASSKYSNWNAKGYTRKKYYDVKGDMKDLNTDAEMDAYCIEKIKLGIVKLIELKYPTPVYNNGQVVNYKVISKIYTSTATSSSIAKVIWNEEKSAYELESLDIE